MSTRCQIGFYSSRETDLTKWEALIYQHSDGYPDGDSGVIATILPILRDFDVKRGLSDVEYSAAWLVAKLKTGYLNIGISKDFHGDIEFYYAVYPTMIVVYETEGPDPKSWNEVQRISIDGERT